MHSRWHMWRAVPRALCCGRSVSCDCTCCAACQCVLKHALPLRWCCKINAQLTQEAPEQAAAECYCHIAFQPLQPLTTASSLFAEATIRTEPRGLPQHGQALRRYSGTEVRPQATARCWTRCCRRWTIWRRLQVVLPVQSQASGDVGLHSLKVLAAMWSIRCCRLWAASPKLQARMTVLHWRNPCQHLSTAERQLALQEQQLGIPRGFCCRNSNFCRVQATPKRMPQARRRRQRPPPGRGQTQPPGWRRGRGARAMCRHMCSGPHRTPALQLQQFGSARWPRQWRSEQCHACSRRRRASRLFKHGASCGGHAAAAACRCINGTAILRDVRPRQVQ